MILFDLIWFIWIEDCWFSIVKLVLISGSIELAAPKLWNCLRLILDQLYHQCAPTHIQWDQWNLPIIWLMYKWYFHLGRPLSSWISSIWCIRNSASKPPATISSSESFNFSLCPSDRAGIVRFGSPRRERWWILIDIKSLIVLMSNRLRSGLMMRLGAEKILSVLAELAGQVGNRSPAILRIVYLLLDQYSYMLSMASWSLENSLIYKSISFTICQAIAWEWPESMSSVNIVNLNSSKAISVICRHWKFWLPPTRASYQVNRNAARKGA